MTGRDLIALALESAIGAELALFAAYLLSSPRRRASALYLLAGLSLCLALVTAGNLLIGNAGWVWLPDIVLFLDLLTPPLIFLYAVQIRRGHPPLRPRDGLHALPACLGIFLWKIGLLPSMDFYVNACWLAYLLATSWTFAAHYKDYEPFARQRFLVLLLCVLAAIWLLRLVIVFGAAGTTFRDGIPYLLILAGIFGATCLMLLTALRHPDLLSLPGSHMKYALSTADDAGLDSLDDRLKTLMAEKRPYLDPDFSVAELSALLGAPARHVSQLINARQGMSFSAYMNSHRTGLAAKLLETTQKPIKTIMFEFGFRSKSIFNREFQRSFGLSPSEYRQQPTAKQI